MIYRRTSYCAFPASIRMLWGKAEGFFGVKRKSLVREERKTFLNALGCRDGWGVGTQYLQFYRNKHKARRRGMGHVSEMVF